MRICVHIVNGALRYRAQAPLLDSLLSEVGINGKDINGLTETVNPFEKLEKVNEASSKESLEEE